MSQPVRREGVHQVGQRFTTANAVGEGCRRTESTDAARPARFRADPASLLCSARMPVPAELAKDPAVAGPLGTLALAVTRPRAAMLGLRALRWHRDLARLGVDMPLCAVHDIGLLLACPNEQLEQGPRVDVTALLASMPGATKMFDAYRALIEEVAGSEAALRSSQLALGDDMVVVLLARLLGPVAERVVGRPPYVAGTPLDAALVEHIEPDLVGLFGAVSRGWDVSALQALVANQLYVLTLVDALDLDTLQLFGMIGGDAGQGALAQVDLLGVLGHPEANDVVDFSLEILPSVLETKTRPGAGTHAAFGYAGLARKGSIDSLMLTELAWDPDELMRRMADDEVLYYAREQARDDSTRIHYVMIDASASMRGERATFARGMALAAAKKLLLSGEEVVFRFFDSRLYEAHPARGGKLPVAYLLSFKGERGRNPSRVFRELANVLDVATRRDSRQAVVHLFTHAALYIPRATVEAMSRSARLAAIFMLPSGGELQLDYLDLLDAYWVVDHKTLASREARAHEAKRILGDVGPVTDRPRAGAP